MSRYDDALRLALADYAPGRELSSIEDSSNQVSTNRVYRVTWRDGEQCFAKVSSYGSYVHFRQDHRLVHQWSELLAGGRFAGFLAPVLGHGEYPFTYRHGPVWVALYGKVDFYDFLPPVLTEGQVEAFGHELAAFHLESARVGVRMEPSWNSVGSDVSILYDALGHPDFLSDCGFSAEEHAYIESQCDNFLLNAERLGYLRMPRIPLLVDWNTTNFSVGLVEGGFKFFSRWDYDWFRVDSRVFDLYFAARVVRAEGDQHDFSYHIDPMFEPRFERFISAYHEVYPLTEQELMFLPQAYRFFVLNYVLRVGQFFFRPEYCTRLRLEVVREHLPALDAADFAPLLKLLRP